METKPRKGDVTFFVKIQPVSVSLGHTTLSFPPFSRDFGLVVGFQCSILNQLVAVEVSPFVIGLQNWHPDLQAVVLRLVKKLLLQEKLQTWPLVKSDNGWGSGAKLCAKFHARKHILERCVRWGGALVSGRKGFLVFQFPSQHVLAHSSPCPSKQDNLLPDRILVNLYCPSWFSSLLQCTIG